MNYNKILLISIMFLMINSCKKDIPQVLIGSQIIEEDHLTGRKYSSNNKSILVISQDSIESVPLWQGCIMSPANRLKLKFNQSNYNGNYVLTDEDTIKFNFEYLGSNVYSNKINELEFRYYSAVNKYVNIDYNNLVKMFKGKSYKFLLNDISTVISFHEKEGYVMNQKIKNEKYISRGRWFINKSGGYYFLIIDDFDTIWKFQIINISDYEIKIYNFNNDKCKEVVMSKIHHDSLSHSNGFWISNIVQNPPFANRYLDELNSLPGIWLRKNDIFVIHDSSTIYNLDSEMKPASVYIDWACNIIIIDYKIVFGFEIDRMDKNKIKLFPVNKNGKLITKISKTYFFE